MKDDHWANDLAKAYKRKFKGNERRNPYGDGALIFGVMGVVIVLTVILVATGIGSAWIFGPVWFGHGKPQILDPQMAPGVKNNPQGQFGPQFDPGAVAEPPQKKKPPAPAVTGDARLDELLADLTSDGPAAQQAGVTLAGMTPNEHQAVVARTLADRLNANKSQRGRYLKALCVWATAEEVPTLIALVNDTKPFLCEPAVDALVRLKDARAIPILVRELHGEFHKKRLLSGLREFGPAAEADVLPLLDTRDPFFRKDVIPLLGDIGTPKSLPALQQIAAKAAFPDERSLAQAAIASIQARAQP